MKKGEKSPQRFMVSTCYHCKYCVRPVGLGLVTNTPLRCTNLEVLRAADEVVVYVSPFEKCELFKFGGI